VYRFIQVLQKGAFKSICLSTVQQTRKAVIGVNRRQTCAVMPLYLITRIASRNFPGRSAVKSVAFGNKWWKASANRGHSTNNSVQLCK